MQLAYTFSADAGIADDGRMLRLVLPEAAGDLAVEAATLWLNCPSALRRRRRLDGLDAMAPDGIRITRIAPIGNYALNIAFSDGHERGVFPWALVAELASRPKVSDFLIPASDAGIVTHHDNTQGCAP